MYCIVLFLKKWHEVCNNKLSIQIQEKPCLIVSSSFITLGTEGIECTALWDTLSHEVGSGCKCKCVFNAYIYIAYCFYLFIFSYLQLVIVAVRMIFHIELKDGDGNATSRACLDVPDALTVCWVFVRIAWAGESTSGPEEFPTTTCRR